MVRLLACDAVKFWTVHLFSLKCKDNRVYHGNEVSGGSEALCLCSSLACGTAFSSLDLAKQPLSEDTHDPDESQFHQVHDTNLDLYVRNRLLPAQIHHSFWGPRSLRTPHTSVHLFWMPRVPREGSLTGSWVFSNACSINPLRSPTPPPPSPSRWGEATSRWRKLYHLEECAWHRFRAVTVTNIHLSSCLPETWDPEDFDFEIGLSCTRGHSSRTMSRMICASAPRLEGGPAMCFSQHPGTRASALDSWMKQRDMSVRARGRCRLDQNIAPVGHVSSLGPAFEKHGEPHFRARDGCQCTRSCSTVHSCWWKISCTLLRNAIARCVDVPHGDSVRRGRGKGATVPSQIGKHSFWHHVRMLR